MAISLGGFSGGGGGASTDTLDDVTGRGATTTNAITVGGLSVGTAYTMPSADGGSGQAIVSDGAGNLSFTTIDPTGALEYKGSFNATAGTPSLANAEQGDYYKIDTAGTIYGQDWAVGDSLLINADMGGTITNSKIDKIDNTDAPASETVAGVIEIATNLEAQGASATNKALVPSNISSIALSSFNDDLSYLSSGDNISVLNNDSGYITSVASASETVEGIIEIATNAEATAATATNKALVPSNISSIALSSFNNDLSFLSSGDNVSELTNDAGYLTSVASASETVEGIIEIATNAEATSATATDKALVPSNLSSINVSTFTNDAGYLTTAGYPVQTATSSITASLNTAVYLTAGSATACTVTLPATSGASDGDAVIIVRRSAGSLTIQQNGADSGTLVTYLDQGNASSHTITNNQQQIHVRYDSSGTRWYIYDKAQGTAALLDVGTTANKVVQLNASAQLPAVDGSLLTNVGKFIDYQLAAFGLNMTKNTGYRLTANSLTLTLPARSTLTDGDYFAITSGVNYSVTVALNTADSGTSNIFYNVGTNSHSTTSHTLSINKQEIFIRFNGTSFFITSETKGGIADVVSDTTPQLGGNLDVNGNEITSASNGNVVINPDGTGEITIGADVVPDANATHTIGSESNRYISTYSDLNGAIRFKAKNDEGSQITKGQAVYIKGISGTVPTVGLADADDASKMPAFGLAFANANDQAELQIVSFGNLTDVNTSTFSAGDTLYIDTTAGALTATKPTGSTAQLQNIGRVLRSDASAGIIKVGGAGRSAATPNLDDGKFFLGNASNQSVQSGYKLPTSIGPSSHVLTSNGTDVVFQAVSGGGSKPDVTVASVATTYPATGDLASSGLEQIYILTPTANTTVNLAPAATCGSGFKYQIKNLGTYTLTITPDSTASEYIDHSSQTTYAIDQQYTNITLVTDGSNWFII